MSRNLSLLNHIKNSTSVAGMNPSGYPYPTNTNPRGVGHSSHPIPVISAGSHNFNQYNDHPWDQQAGGSFGGATSSRREFFGSAPNAHYVPGRSFSSQSNDRSGYSSAYRTDKRKVREDEEEASGAPRQSSSNVERNFVQEIYNLKTVVKRLRKLEQTQFGKLIGNSHDRRMIGDGVRFRFMNYNILSQHLLVSHQQLYNGCDPRALDHEFRKELFFSELDDIEPDIITLQEVEETEFYRALEPTLFLKGFKGVYKKRTGDKLDGCAIFYRATQFGYLDKLSVEFQQPHIPLLNRDNVALFLKLRCNKQGPGRPATLVVGTTHILFNPKRKDIKLAQVQLLLTELDRFAFCGLDSATREPMYNPILLAGDFNADPHSALIKFITEGIYRAPGPEDRPSTANPKYWDVKQVLPTYVGISDQCQHYKLTWERLNVWKSVREDHFRISSKVEPTLLNIKLSSMKVSSEKDLIESANSGRRVTFDSRIDSASSMVSSSNVTPQSFNSLVQTSNGSAITTEVMREDYSSTSIQSFESGSQYTGFSETSLFDSASASLPMEVNETELTRILEELANHEIDCTFGTGDLSHNLRLSSVYAPLLDRENADDLGVTTKHTSWKKVDYIFYNKIWNKKYRKVTEGNLRLVRRLGLLSRDESKKIGPIPNLANSSDHYCLVAEFVLK